MIEPNSTARRCSTCDENWPMNTNYKKCPICTRDTWESSRTAPLTEVEARAQITAAADERRRLDTRKEAVIRYELEHLDAEWAAFAV